MNHRFPFLDGMRGLAALCVVFFHGYLIARWQCGALPTAYSWAAFPFQFGRSAVGVFIVLSGFVLALPILKAGGTFDAVAFARKRARRILPPYYVAVLLGLAVCSSPIAASPQVWASVFQPAFHPEVLWSHLFLVHNLKPELAYRINISVWSLATEVQIYVVFALLLLPLWRRFGIGLAVAVAWVLGIAVTLAFPSTRIGAPWYLGLFSLGMLAAQIRLRPEMAPKWARLPWRRVAALLWGGFFACVIPWQASGFDTQDAVADVTIFYDTLLGFATAASILAGCDGARFFERPAFQGLGTISYSLYLTHAPLMGALGWACWSLRLGPWMTTLVLYALGVPLSLRFAKLFYKVIEAPSQRWAANSAGSRSAPSTPERASTVRSARAGAGR